ncbi:MAG TPA: glycosyltransferase family 9 protein [bacterium]|nr:glycosyltransferase family 9 protein [bacterium]
MLISFLSRGLGDCIYLGALLGPLRRRFPAAEISLAILAHHEHYFRGNPFIDRVLPCPDYEQKFPQNFLNFLNSSLRIGQKERFDLLLDLCPTLALEPALWSALIPKTFSIGTGDSVKRIFYDFPVSINWQKHFYEALAEGLRPLGIRPEKPEFWVPPGTPPEWLLPGDFRKEKSVIIAPGGKRNIEAPKDYCWIFEGFGEVIEALTARGIRIILAGAPYDRPVVETLRPHPLMLDLVGKTSIGQIFTLVKEYARLVVCNNSGLLHVACALDVPTVSYADPQENMLRWAPYPPGEKHIWLQDKADRKISGEEFLNAVCRQLEAESSYKK